MSNFSEFLELKAAESRERYLKNIRPEILEKLECLRRHDIQFSKPDWALWFSENGMNSYEREACVPFMDVGLLVQEFEYCLSQCAPKSRQNRPCSIYDDAVVNLYAPELLRRLKSQADEIEALKSQLAESKAQLAPEFCGG